MTRDLRVRPGRRAGLILPGLFLLLGLGALQARAAGSLERVSVSSSGAQANDVSFAPVLNEDGRVVAFQSRAKNLVTGGAGSVDDIFVRDLSTGTTELVSADRTGGPGGGGNASLDGSGRLVVFSSGAANLVAADTNGKFDVFIRDRESATTELVSIRNSASGSVQGNDVSDDPALSADGRRVAFTSLATNLASGTVTGRRHILVRNRTTRGLVHASIGIGGTAPDGNSTSPALSADGQFVAFNSVATNLVAGDTNGLGDIFVRGFEAGVTERISVAVGSEQPNGPSDQPGLSADGRFVVFQSSALNLVAGDTNNQPDVFVRDRAAGTTERVSVGENGMQGNGRSDQATISGDGRFVAFRSEASNLVTGDSNARLDAFVRDRLLHLTFRISATSGAAQGNGAVSNSGRPAISGDGRFVAFASDSTNLVPNDTNNFLDIFLRDLYAGLAPVSPSDLVAVPLSSTQIRLTWTDTSTNEGGFQVQRDDGAGFTVIGAAASNATAFTDTGLAPGSLHVYRIRAVNAIGASDLSNEAVTETGNGPPPAPANLVAEVISSSRVDLVWTDTSTIETGFQVERKQGTGNFVQVATLPRNTPFFSNTGLPAGALFTYRVRAFNGDGNSAFSNTAQVVIVVPPDGLTATAVSSSRIDLQWTDRSNNESGFRIERRLGSGSFSQIAQVGANVTSFQNTALTPNRFYAYRVRAFNGNGNTAFSTTAGTATPPAPPAAPSGLTAVAGSAGRINLQWTDASTNEQGFKVERKVGTGSFVQIASPAANVRTFVDMGLQAGLSCTYRVRAFNADGFSAYSNTATATAP